MARGCRANLAAGAFGGARDGAAILLKGAQALPEAAVRTIPRALSMELPMGSRSVHRNGQGPPCKPCHWNLRWSPL
eukprot:5387795-Pyramimonas_sp.AAC.1